MYKHFDISKLFMTILLSAALWSCAQVPYNSSLAAYQAAFAEAVALQIQIATASFQENEQNLTLKQEELRELARKQTAAIFKTSLGVGSAVTNNTILEGTVTGAALGTVIGTLTGRVPIVGAAAGGAVAGAVAGMYVAHKQQQYTHREDQLNSMITDVRQLNQENQAILDKMREVLAEDKRKIVDLEKQYQRKKISEEEYQRELAVVKSDRELMNSMVLKAENRLAVFKEAKTAFVQTNPDVNVQNYNKEVENGQSTINTMTKVVSDLTTVAWMSTGRFQWA